MEKKSHALDLVKALGKFLYMGLFRSPESKVLAVVMIVSLILSAFNNAHLVITLFKISAYTTILSLINCMVYGQCRYSIAMFLLFSIPFFGIIIQILELMGWFQNQSGYIKKIYISLTALSPSEKFKLVLDDDHEKIKDKVKKDVTKFIE